MQSKITTRPDRMEGLSTCGHQRQQILHAIRFRARNQDGDTPPSRHDEKKAIAFHRQLRQEHPPAIFADLSGDSTSGFDFTPIQQFNISLSRFHVFEDLDTRLPICTGTPLLVSKPDSSIACEMRSKLGKVTLLNYVPKNYRTAHSALRTRGRFGHAIIGLASWIAPT